MGKTTSGTYKSGNGIDQVHYWYREPAGPPKGILQIAHGMAEHSGRYGHVADFFTGEGYVVCANDHLGHGKTASSPSDYGFFGKKPGWWTMVEDMAGLTLRMKEIFPGLPVFLQGHSMGSFLGRIYLTRYGTELAGAIFTGTSAGDPKAAMALPLTAAMTALRGHRFRSRLLYGIAFGKYNERYGANSDRLGWMSQDPAVLSAFRRDPACNFVLTVAGFRDMTHMVLFINRPEWPSEVPLGLPILLLSGENDPVGAYGEGVRRVYEALAAAGCTDVSMKLYPDTRHEILNEPVKMTALADIAAFMGARLG